MEDEDMIIVIVGDGVDGENNDILEPIKEEVQSEEVEKLIETAELHGEIIKVDIKEEPVENESIDEDSNSDDEDYVPEESSVKREDSTSDDEDYVPEESRPIVKREKQRLRMLKPSERKSFVKELRDLYPELRNDEDALITCLSEIMKNIKPPAPPKDYCIINGKSFECTKCGLLVDSVLGAGRHYQQQHGERYLVCFACGVDFRCTVTLYKHEKRCVAPDAQIVLRARALSIPRKRRTRPYMNLTNSKKKPQKYRPPKKKPIPKHQCSQCPSIFVSKAHLTSHELLHRGERPYMCTQCPAAYTSPIALLKHTKKHGDEQFLCDNCGKGFNVKSSLISHMDTHLPVKKYGCDRCDKRYATKGAVERHVNTQHLGMPPPCACNICPKRYLRMSDLKEHTKKAHGLLLMTRNMFFKSLPTMSDTQIEQAKVVLKSDKDTKDYIFQPLSDQTPTTVKRSSKVAKYYDHESSD